MFNTKYAGEAWTNPDIAQDLKNRIDRINSEIQGVEFDIEEFQGAVTAMDKELRDNDNLALAIFELQEAQSKLLNAWKALNEFKKQEEIAIASDNGPA